MGYYEYEVRLSVGFLFLPKRKRSTAPYGTLIKKYLPMSANISHRRHALAFFRPRDQRNLADPAMTQIWEDTARQ